MAEKQKSDKDQRRGNSRQQRLGGEQGMGRQSGGSQGGGQGKANKAPSERGSSGGKEGGKRDH